MQYEANRANDTGGEPHISAMVEKAIKILQKDGDGFLLMVEGVLTKFKQKQARPPT